MPFTSRAKDRAASRFEMRLTASERVQPREEADLAGMSISELVHKRAFGKTIYAATDLVMIRELRRLKDWSRLIYAMSGKAQLAEQWRYRDTETLGTAILGDGNRQRPWAV